MSAAAPLSLPGCPPITSASHGQLWGNPIYNWNALRESGYHWYVARLKSLLAHVDVIRLDHFRGFCAAWHVPAGAATAEVGKWVPGPGADLFEEIERELRALPFIAEDLGTITPDVGALRDQLGLPGMRILQFAFDGDPQNPYLPPNYVSNTVVYTGTHDNPTTRNWFEELPDRERKIFWSYLGRTGGEVREAAPALMGLGVVVQGRALDSAFAGSAQSRQRSPHERSRPRRRQLGLALQGRHAVRRGLSMAGRSYEKLQALSAHGRKIDCIARRERLSIQKESWYAVGRLGRCDLAPGFFPGHK